MRFLCYPGMLSHKKLSVQERHAMKYKDCILLKAITTLFYKTPYTPFD